jgi:pSer/pThr/pTyr-binding forkhead associated (FHA) protein
MKAILDGPFGQLTLSVPVLAIGRASANQLVINDKNASGHHAEIRSLGQKGYSITDLGSTNGTFVNGQRLEKPVPRTLANGETIRVGDTSFLYVVLDLATEESERRTNESVADGASSKNINEKGASEAPKNERSFKVKVWMVLLAGVALFLVVSAVGGYAFNWTWTGFQGNHLWDWIKLLLLPVVLGTASLSFKGHQREWTVVLVVAAVTLLVALVGGYIFNWSWTGFQGNHLWDWLVLLLLPIGLAATKLSYDEYQRLLKKMREGPGAASS